MWDIKLKLIETDNSMVVTRGKGGGRTIKGKGIKYMVMEDYLTLGGGNTMQYTDHIS